MIHVVFIAFSSFSLSFVFGLGWECELWVELRSFLHRMHLPSGVFFFSS